MKDLNNFDEFYSYVGDLLENEQVQSMKKYMQHGNISCFDHSVYVAYMSFRLCKRLGLNARSAARGGMLHDFFLYDWHIEGRLNNWHGFTHPRIALKNAGRCFTLSDMERDIIAKHMWPLTLKFPRYKEAYVVNMVDTFCAAKETFCTLEPAKMRRLILELR